MKLVYQLSEELKSNFERVSVTQALTLDDSRPLIGLTGSLGLFGSREWWDNIKQGVMPLLRISGIVLRAYCAGQVWLTMTPEWGEMMEFTSKP